MMAALLALAQPDTTNVPNSTLGWQLSPHGTIRILVLFAEVEWDVDPSKDPASPTAAHWPKGSLPTWKDDLFDPHPLPEPRAMVSRYYHDISLGHYVVLGDYVDRIITLKQSEYASVTSAHIIGTLAAQEASKSGELVTRHGLRIADFDLWKDGGKAGLPKERGPDSPHRYDHVMVIVRNNGLTHGQGSTDPGSAGKLFGYESDTQSRFGGMNALPFEILKHEFNHLLLGGNNFHSGGGNAAQFNSFFLPLQGGHSMMGASGSALLTCSAWDRDRLGWAPSDARYRINARNVEGAAVNGDLDPMAGDTGIFVLRDMVTTGDALRIRLPFIPDNCYQQWIWLENHQGHAVNVSPTDRFHWQDQSCVEPMRPGLFAYLQVDRDKRHGGDVFGGYADYLRPLPANGLFDLRLLGDTVGACPFGGHKTIAYSLDADRANPFTGNHELELPLVDRNGDGKLQRAEHFVPYVRVEGQVHRPIAPFYGRPEHAFLQDGKRVLGLSTNPSTANQLTLVSSGTRTQHGGKAPDVRATYLNGIRVELLPGGQGSQLRIHVRNDDTVIDHDVRWCSDSIVLPPLRGRDGRSLTVQNGATLLLDRSLTPTRLDKPEKANGETYFAPATRFTLQPGAHLHVREGSTLSLEKGTEVHVLPGAHLQVEDRALLRMDRDCRIIVHGDARVSAKAKTLRKLRKKGQVVTMPQ
jgi:hypothetical protein